MTTSVHPEMCRTHHAKLEQNVVANGNQVKYVKWFLKTRTGQMSEVTEQGLNQDPKAEEEKRKTQNKEKTGKTNPRISRYSFFRSM